MNSIFIKKKQSIRSYYLTTQQIMKLLSVIIVGRCIGVHYFVTHLEIELKKKIYENCFIDINMH